MSVYEFFFCEEVCLPETGNKPSEESTGQYGRLLSDPAVFGVTLFRIVILSSGIRPPLNISRYNAQNQMFMKNDYL